MDPRHRFGREAERIAERHYLARGFRTLARNYRVRCGELDLVMERGGLLLFVEVKGRRGDWRGGAWADRWGPKIRRLRAAMVAYLQRESPEFEEIRLEIVFVTPGRVEVCYRGV